MALSFDKHEYALDKQCIRRCFDRAAPSYGKHDCLQRMVREEMLERLEWIRIQPLRVLDLGCGNGAATRALRKRYPKAQVIGLDLSENMIREAKRHQFWWRKSGLVCGDMERLPFRAHSIDLIFSSLALQWSMKPERVFEEVRRVLKPSGVALFSTLGPDTLRELRQAWAEVDDKHAHVNMFYDMHDLGDAMVQAGLRDPVMDVDRLSLLYPSADAVMRSLKGTGASNGMAGRARGLTGKGVMGRVKQAYERLADADGNVPATYEVIHAQAWGSEVTGYRANSDGVVRIPLSALKR